MRRASQGRIVALTLFLSVSVFPASGAAPPEVLRLRVPTERVPTWFPPGTEIKGMSAERFESLLRGARAGASRQDEAGRTPRLLHASHTARWEDGALHGLSELIIEPPRSGPGA